LISHLFLCGFLLLLPAGAGAQTDDFEDGNHAVWTKYDPLAALGLGPRGTWTETNGVHRIQALASPNPAFYGPGRAASLRPNLYTNFYVAVDLVDWNNNWDQAIGLLARMRNPGLATSDGYALTYQPVDQDIQINRVDKEKQRGISPALRLVLEPGRHYRMVFIGVGPNMEGRVYALPNIRTPILQLTATPDATYPSGISGMVVVANEPGDTGSADATFDNYLAMDSEPPTLSLGSTMFLDEVRLNWSTNFAAHVLQWSSSLSAPVTWTDISNGVVRAGAEFEYLDGSTQPARFYRLRR